MDEDRDDEDRGEESEEEEDDEEVDEEDEDEKEDEQEDEEEEARRRRSMARKRFYFSPFPNNTVGPGQVFMFFHMNQPDTRNRCRHHGGDGGDGGDGHGDRERDKPSLTRSRWRDHHDRDEMPETKYEQSRREHFQQKGEEFGRKLAQRRNNVIETMENNLHLRARYVDDCDGCDEGVPIFEVEHATLYLEAVRNYRDQWYEAAKALKLPEEVATQICDPLLSTHRMVKEVNVEKKYEKLPRKFWGPEEQFQAQVDWWSWEFAQDQKSGHFEMMAWLDQEYHPGEYLHRKVAWAKSFDPFNSDDDLDPEDSAPEGSDGED